MPIEHIYVMADRIKLIIPDVRRAVLAALAEGLLDADDDELECGLDEAIYTALVTEPWNRAWDMQEVTDDELAPESASRESPR